MIHIQIITNYFKPLVESATQRIQKFGQTTGITGWAKQTAEKIENKWNETKEIVQRTTIAFVDEKTNNAAYFHARPIAQIKISLNDPQVGQRVEATLKEAVEICDEVTKNEETRSNSKSLVAGIASAALVATYVIGEVLPALPPLIVEGHLFTRAPIPILLTTTAGIVAFATVSQHLDISPETQAENDHARFELKSLKIVNAALQNDEFVEFAKKTYPDTEFSTLEFSNRYVEFTMNRKAQVEEILEIINPDQGPL